MRQALVVTYTVAAAAAISWQACAFHHQSLPAHQRHRRHCLCSSSPDNGDFATGGLQSAAAVDAAVSAVRPTKQQPTKEQALQDVEQWAARQRQQQQQQQQQQDPASWMPGKPGDEDPERALAKAAAFHAAAVEAVKGTANGEAGDGQQQSDQRRRVARLDSEALQVGGLDHVVEAIRRRVWLPLCAPQPLLDDLGIAPVSGLLLHGPPGCGKSLLARRLSALLSPRPPSFVSGPEIMDRFVGSSEANIRSLFKYPPRPLGGTPYPDGALHVIVLDEFDAIAGSRSDRGGGDAGERVRDSVVNQLLACMDGVQELDARTLLIGLTNRRDLIDRALLRPGRFEVHIEVSHPDARGRADILRIHCQRMFAAGRLDIPATAEVEFTAFLQGLAERTEGFSGAELAGMARAAAAYALDRAALGSYWDVDAARVTADDFERGLQDVMPTTTLGGGGGSGGGGSGAEDTPLSKARAGAGPAAVQ